MQPRSSSPCGAGAVRSALALQRQNAPALRSNDGVAGMTQCRRIKRPLRTDASSDKSQPRRSVSRRERERALACLTRLFQLRLLAPLPVNAYLYMYAAGPVGSNVA